MSAPYFAITFNVYIFGLCWCLLYRCKILQYYNLTIHNALKLSVQYNMH